MAEYFKKTTDITLLILLLCVLARNVYGTTCASGWTKNSNDGECYKVIKSPRSWVKAEEYCRSYDAHLTSVHNSNYDFLDTLYDDGGDHDDDKYWIGGVRYNASEIWQWIDGKPFDITKWKKGEPNDHGDQEYCIHVTDGKWNDQRCDTKMNFICTKRNVSFPTSHSKCSWKNYRCKDNRCISLDSNCHERSGGGFSFAWITGPIVVIAISSFVVMRYFKRRAFQRKCQQRPWAAAPQPSASQSNPQQPAPPAKSSQPPSTISTGAALPSNQSNGNFATNYNTAYATPMGVPHAPPPKYEDLYQKNTGYNASLYSPAMPGQDSANTALNTPAPYPPNTLAPLHTNTLPPLQPNSQAPLPPIESRK